MNCKLTMLSIALSLCAAAQTFTTNVPGVTLSGDPGNPLITNHTGKPVVAALVVRPLSDKTVATARRFFTDTAALLPDGGAELVGEYSRKIPHSMYISGNVDAVVFADGEFRGNARPDQDPQFRENVEHQLQAIRKVWQMAKAGDWDGLKAEAASFGDGNIYAIRLIWERDRPGAVEAKVVGRFAHWALLPASTWKGGLLNKLRTAPGIQAIAEWFVPLVAHAQSASYCCVITYPQDSTTDDYHPTQWNYRCGSSYSNPCPGLRQNTPPEGIAAVCSDETPNYYMADVITLSMDDNSVGNPTFTINAGEVQPGGPTYTLKNFGVCNNNLYGWFESYRYDHSCVGSGISHIKPVVIYDTTGTSHSPDGNCGAIPSGYAG